MFSLSSLKKLPFHGQSPTRGISCDPLLLGRSLWLIPLGLNWNVTIGTAGFATGPLECGFVGCVVNYNPIIIEWWKTKVFPTLSPQFGGGSLLFKAACWDGGVPLNNGAIEVRLRRCHCTYFHSFTQSTDSLKSVETSIDFVAEMRLCRWKPDLSQKRAQNTCDGQIIMVEQKTKE